MRRVIKDSIYNILDRIICAIEERDTFGLKQLSNYTIHNASIFQDEDSLSIAIITYSISKLLDRKIIPEDDDMMIRNFLINLTKMRTNLQNEEYSSYRNKICNIFKSIKKLDMKTKDYVDEVILKSKIKKGTAMYEHGISLSRVATAMGITEWDLREYIGNTNSNDAEKLNKKVSLKRLKFAKTLFGI